MGDVLAENRIFSATYNLVNGMVPDGWSWVAYLVAGMSIIMLVVNSLMIMATFYTWVERRLLGRFQSRLGPNRAGPFGLLQPIADLLKLISKEDILPRSADRIIFNVAPVLMLAATLIVLAVVPFGRGSYIADLNIGILFVVAISGIGTFSIFMAGWASANKYAMFGSMRAIAALVSYEVPMVIAILSVVVLARSMSMVDIVEGQSLPFILVLPLGFIIFMVSISAELNRAPFDIVEAESELISGYNTEYSGMKFGTFFAAEFANVLVASAVIAVLFLQGWRWAVLPSHLWFLMKVGTLAFVFIWIRATLPRLRIDQILGFAWKFLLPLSLINLVVAAVEVLSWPEQTALQQLYMALINWPVAIVSVVAFSKIVSRRQPVQPVVRAPVAQEVG